MPNTAEHPVSGSERVRPLRNRVWFYRPGSWCPGWRVVQTGGDEFNWHTLVIGSRVTGAVVVATRPCNGTGKCAEDLADPDLRPEDVLASPWPVDVYGHDHTGCHKPDCYCRG